MIVVINTFPKNSDMVTRYVDCDNILKIAEKEALSLTMYKDNKIVYDMGRTTHKVRVFITDFGKTVEKIWFDPKI